uniref:Putative C3a receptor C3aR n=1 Tax=Botryllus schlosseri TaxID=30301 RepID=A0A7S6BG03_BOTSH|nr:putative C3a receptor C3aR [Botryllus schlosseri]
MSLVVVVGILGNAIVFFVILVLQEYRKSVSNWYVLQLALADTLFLLMLPFGAAEEMAGKWYFPASLCKAKEGILMVNYYASILFLTIMSFDRSVAVTSSGVSRWSNVLRRLDSAALISLIAWLVSIGLAVPMYLYSHVTQCDECSYNFPLTDQERCDRMSYNDTQCAEYLLEESNPENVYTNYLEPEEYDKLFNFFTQMQDNMTDENTNTLKLLNELANSENDICKTSSPQSYRTWLYLNVSILLVLPFVLICIFYGMILYTMMGTATTACTNKRQYRRRVTLMVLALVTLFIVSWLPWYVVTLAKVRGFPMSESGCTKLTNFVRVLTYLNSALNPYFYSFMGSRFHRRFRRARSTATRKYRFLSVLSRLSFHGQDSNNSTSGGTCKTNLTGRDLKLSTRIKSNSDDDSRSSVRTERTVVDQTHLPSVTST